MPRSRLVREQVADAVELGGLQNPVRKAAGELDGGDRRFVDGRRRRDERVLVSDKVGEDLEKDLDLCSERLEVRHAGDGQRNAVVRLKALRVRLLDAQPSVTVGTEPDPHAGHSAITALASSPCWRYMIVSTYWKIGHSLGLPTRQGVTVPEPVLVRS